MSGINQKDYLKKYLGIGKGSGEKKKKKKARKIGNGLKIVDDDIDVHLNEEIQVDLSADNDEAPQIVSVIDDRPPSLRIDEDTHSNLWKPIGALESQEQVNKSIKVDRNLKLSTNLGIKQVALKNKKDLSSDTKYSQTKKASKRSHVNREISSSRQESPKINALVPTTKIKSESVSSDQDFSPVRERRKSENISATRRGKTQINSDYDNSPSRGYANEFSPLRKEKGDDSDNSVPRRRHSDNSSPLRKWKDDSDNSPPGRPRIDGYISPVKKRRNSDSDYSPPRKCADEFSSLRKKIAEDSDNSPPRNSGIIKNISSVRKRKNSGSDSSSPRRQSDDSSSLKNRKEENSDNSPPRRSRIDGDISPVRKKRKNNDSSTSRRKDMSPPRQIKADLSPPRRSKAESHNDLTLPRRGRGAETDSSPSRKIKKEKIKDNSPLQRRREGKKSRWGKWDDSEENDEKLKKTLDGKTAGLQNAADLVKETVELKKREDELFGKLSSEVSGVNAATVVRKKKKEVDPEEEERIRKIEENKEKYNRWGKGLKQVDDTNEKIKNDLYEMSKPLARYADDKDLEKHLKDQERDGDPMLAYIRQKKRKKAVEQEAPVIQQYEGDAPPNRFGIRPGYRWDGVDRSNGYEKKWFEEQNSRQAKIEESYKWSTEDM